MRWICDSLTVVLWGGTIALFSRVLATHQLWKVTPIISYNRPHGFLGWMLTGAVVMTMVSVGVHRTGIDHKVLKAWDSLSRAFLYWNRWDSAIKFSKSVDKKAKGRLQI